MCPRRPVTTLSRHPSLRSSRQSSMFRHRVEGSLHVPRKATTPNLNSKRKPDQSGPEQQRSPNPVYASFGTNLALKYRLLYRLIVSGPQHGQPVRRCPEPRLRGLRQPSPQGEVVDQTGYAGVYSAKSKVRPFMAQISRASARARCRASAALRRPNRLRSRTPGR